MGTVSKSFSDLITFTRASAATVRNSSGVLVSVPANTPRIDYDPVTLACRGLLIEEQRTNLLLQSQTFSNWTLPAGMTLTNSSEVAPDGGAMIKVTPAASTIAHGMARAATGMTAGQKITTSLYAKAGELSLIQIYWTGGATGVSSAYVNFDLINGTASEQAGATASITHTGNGIYRCVATCTITGDMTTGTDTGIICITSMADTRRPTKTFNGTDSIHIWGAQTEIGSFATSYIPTTTAQVTRAADIPMISLDSTWFNPVEGTIYAEFLPRFNSGSAADVVSIEGTAGNFIKLLVNSSFAPGLQVQVDGADQALLNTQTITANAVNKLVGAFKANDFSKAFANALESDTAGSIPSVTTARLSGLNGHLRKLRVFPKKLDNAALQALSV